MPLSSRPIANRYRAKADVNAVDSAKDTALMLAVRTRERVRASNFAIRPSKRSASFHQSYSCDRVTVKMAVGPSKERAKRGPRSWFGVVQHGKAYQASHQQRRVVSKPLGKNGVTGGLHMCFLLLPR